MGGSIVAGTRLGRYEIVEHLATGSMAELLLARASGLEGFERHVVIKRIRAEQEDDQAFVDMFLHEARLAGSLHHHNIVQVYDIGEEHGKPYFAMEYVHGEDLRALLRRLHERGEQLPLQHLVTIVAAVATALHHAHEQRGPDRAPLDIVHRDVTPANILVGYDGNVKVVDFGIARATVRRAATQAGMLVGRAPYMAPEQCTGAAIDRRCDIFALGVVMYELATVRRLFKGANEFLTMSAIVKGTIPKPSTLREDLPPQLDALILRMLAREPAARYQTGHQVIEALEALALALGLRTSATALAAYMKHLFGERREPWLGGERTPAASIDFDEGPGVVATPAGGEGSALLRTTRSSPIVRAAETAASELDDDDAATTVIADARDVPAAPVVTKGVSLAVAAKVELPDDTIAQEVELDLPIDEVKAAPPAPARTKKLLLIGVGGLAVLGVIVAFAIGSSKRTATTPPPTTTRASTTIVEPPPAAPEPPPVVEEPKPDEVTPVPPPAPPKPTMKPKPRPKLPKPKAKPSVKSPKPAPAAKPSWDPDALFPKK